MTTDTKLFNKTVEKYMEQQDVSKEEAIADLKSIGPKGLREVGVTIDDGWRAGYTKQPLNKRVEKRRKKEKARRAMNSRKRKMRSK